MGRRSSILALPGSVRTQVDQWILSREMSDLDIVARMAEMGFEVSKSALGRYALGLRNALGKAAEYPVLQTDPNGPLWLLLTEMRQLRAAVDTLQASIASGAEHD